MENSIELDGVNKKFRRVSLSHNYQTLKSYLLARLSGKAGAPGSASRNGAFEALRDVSFSVPKGQTWGIIGRNGSGKSTILKLIAGIYKPDSGTLAVNGRVSALIELGAGFHPDFSGRENVFINASILGLRRRDIIKKFDEIVSFAELEDFIDNPVRTYSSGMFMRLGFSVAIHVDPDILLVDEVLAVGDQSFGEKCREKMDAFKKAGKTIVLVTHDLSEVERWCDGAVWVDRGEVKRIGKPNRVVDEYLSSVAESENRTILDGKDKEKQEPEEQRNRWGTREVEITRVTMRGGDGEERYVYHTGDAMTVEVEYTAHKAVAEPVFGVAIYKTDGSLCYGVNTDIEGMKIDRVEGPGRVTLTFDRLDLVNGSYTLSLAAHAKDGHPYDYHDQMYEFSVRSKLKEAGVFRPPHSWGIEGAGVSVSRTDEGGAG